MQVAKASPLLPACARAALRSHSTASWLYVFAVVAGLLTPPLLVPEVPPVALPGYCAGPVREGWDGAQLAIRNITASSPSFIVNPFF
jgi:hypothetical protein